MATRPLAVGRTPTASVPRALVSGLIPKSYSEGTQLSKTLRFPFAQTLIEHSADQSFLRITAGATLPGMATSKDCGVTMRVNCGKCVFN